MVVGSGYCKPTLVFIFRLLVELNNNNYFPAIKGLSEKYYKEQLLKNTLYISHQPGLDVNTTQLDQSQISGTGPKATIRIS